MGAPVWTFLEAMILWQCVRRCYSFDTQWQTRHFQIVQTTQDVDEILSRTFAAKCSIYKFSLHFTQRSIYICRITSSFITLTKTTQLCNLGRVLMRISCEPRSFTHVLCMCNSCRTPCVTHVKHTINLPTKSWCYTCYTCVISCVTQVHPRRFMHVWHV